MRTGVIDVGGGMRGIYAAGILDTCIEQGVYFDHCIGISAGSANVVSYMAGQKGRNYPFYHDYSFRKEYMGLGHFLKTGSYINLEYVYGTLSNSGGENPLNYQKLLENPAKLTIFASDAVTGEKKLFHQGDMTEDNYRILMASSCVPVANRPVQIGDSFYYDGALANPVPVEWAFQHGCDRIVLILTKPVEDIRKPDNDLKLARILRRKYPMAAKNISLRAERYNAGVRLARKYEKEGKALILSPKNTFGVDTLKKDKDGLHKLYEEGVHDGECIKKWMNDGLDC